jgi:hypothetical protein
MMTIAARILPRFFDESAEAVACVAVFMIDFVCKSVVARNRIKIAQLRYYLVCVIGQQTKGFMHA